MLAIALTSADRSAGDRAPGVIWYSAQSIHAQTYGFVTRIVAVWVATDLADRKLRDNAIQI